MAMNKKSYDLFNQKQPLASVRLPGADLRQPEKKVAINDSNHNIAPSMLKLEAQPAGVGEGRSIGALRNEKTKASGEALNNNIEVKVKIPRFTYDIPSGDLSSQPPRAAAVIIQHPQSNRRHTKKPVKGSQSVKSGTAGGPERIGKGLSKAKSTSSDITSTKRRPAAAVSDTPAVSHPDRANKGRQIPATSHIQGVRTKRAKKRASLDGRLSMNENAIARAGHGDEKATNEKDRPRSANQSRSSVTSPQSKRPFPVPSAPKVRKGNARVNASTREWADYADRASSPPQHPSPMRSSRQKPRGGKMYQQASRSFQAERMTRPRQNGGPVARSHRDWTRDVEIQITLFNLDHDIDTADLWSSFHKEGNITRVELFEDSSGRRTGRAAMRFSPPPARAFWNADDVYVTHAGKACVPRIELDPPLRTFMATSPLNKAKKYPELMILNADSVDFGIMYDESTMMSMFTAVHSAQKPIQFRQSMLHREIVIELELDIFDPRPAGTHPEAGKYNRTDKIRFSIPFHQLEEIRQTQANQHIVNFLVCLDQPPMFYRKIDELHTHENKGRFWNQRDAWYRQTDILYDPRSLKTSPIALRKLKPLIDIGRWTTYRFRFDMRHNDLHTFNEICQALKDHNIRITPFPSFELIKDREPAVWDFIDKPVVIQAKPRSILEELSEEVVRQLAFPVRFQLEVCISQGCLNEHNLTRDFVKQLMDMDPIKAQDVLEYVANQKKRLFDPLKIFTMAVVKGSTSTRKIPYYCAYVRSATITPSTIYYNTPAVETSNRVIRQYAEYGDRFLRVRFTDEKFQGRINSTDKDTMDEVFTRIKRTMNNGITIGDRHYEFLAFGNSQFREHGAYFFARLPHIDARRIRSWMGDFTDRQLIPSIAKHAARLGQCFSTTRAINCAKVTVVEIEDIEREKDGKKYNFTDGVGKISPFLAQLAASELGLTAPEAPSLYQFRLGGCKGVLVVWPDAKSKEIHIRESQYKFPARHEGLEIIKWSQLSSATLNRQLVLVLSSLGVADDVFTGKLKIQLASLQQAMTEEKAALAILQKDIDPNQMTLALAGMVLDGFMKTREPFLMSLLQLWRAWSTKYLKEKARITISDGAFLFGCVDEIGVLKGHIDDVVIDDTLTLEEKEKMIPEVFVQLSKGPDGKAFIVKGPMILARNPSLHPGDIRVVRGVDAPEFRHLKDVVVLPQTGDRDIAGMCSGGDLDGDEFTVMWDKDLLPLEWNLEPMDFTPPAAPKIDRAVTVDDITFFFVTYMRNDAVGMIARMHLAQADFLEYGVRDDKCLELARLHSMAVDYNKSGIPARMTRTLRPRKWPHFMEKTHLPDEQKYDSQKILGQLYDQVERVDFKPVYDKPFDQRIVHAYRLDDKIIQTVASLKLEYDAAMRRIMAQHEIKTEFEVWSTFVLHHAGVVKDFKFQAEEIGRLSQELKDEFRAQCYRKAGGKDFEHIAPFVAAMYYVTNYEMQMALHECHRIVKVAGKDEPMRKMEPPSMPLMSFPWLFQNILGRIANGKPSSATGDMIVPVQGDSKRSGLKKKIFNDDDSDLLLETTEGVTHRGETLLLFEDQGKAGEQQVTPKISPASSLEEADLGKAIEHQATPTPKVSPASCLEESFQRDQDDAFEDQGTASEHQGSTRISPASSLEELFRREQDDIGTLSKILTPDDTGSASSSGHHTPPSTNLTPNDFRPPSLSGRHAPQEAQLSSTDSLVHVNGNGSTADDDSNESEDEEDIVEVTINRNGPSYLDRLARLNEM